MSLTLYGYWRSSATYRVRIALELKRLAYEVKPVDLRAGAQATAPFMEMNPQGLVPCLVDDEIFLTQSLSIIEYLDERYPLPALLPAQPILRARARAAALAIACDIHPINNLRILGYLRQQLDQPQAAIDNWMRHWIEEGLSAIEKICAEGSFLFGDDVTIADICLVPQMYNARRVGADLSRVPRLVEIDERLRSLDTFRRAHPDLQIDAMSDLSEAPDRLVAPKVESE